MFVALQDITFDMGPTLVFPKTHTTGAEYNPHAALKAGDTTLVPLTLAAGSVAVMDSRLVHCGGSNTATCGSTDSDG